jgi:NRAMP (natural resistance-associated macrophage protein)-like metal ion transporter
MRRFGFHLRGNGGYVSCFWHRPKTRNAAERKFSDPSGGSKNRSNSIRRFVKALGPGLITGASDDDPSGIGTYATAGARLGYGALWTALLTFPLMVSVQFICAKVGLVTGYGLAGVIRRYYPRSVLFPVVLALFFANTINAAADIGAIAAGLNLLIPIPAKILIVPIGSLLLILQLWGSYRFITGIFKWLTLSLFAYIGASFLAEPDWTEVLWATLSPTIRLDITYLSTLVAILGTTISPYLFFWQTNQVVEEKKTMPAKKFWKRQRTTDGELHYAAWDVGLGMFFSNVVMYFIILATAATLHKTGHTNITSAADAAVALRPLAGDWAYLLMALGLIGTGLLAVPILMTSGAYAICEAFGWKWGLDNDLRRAKHFYLVIGGSTAAALLLNFIGVDSIEALYWAAIINGFLTPPLLVIIMLIANNKAIMGDRVNAWTVNLLGGLTALLMAAAALSLLFTWIS